MSVAVSSGDGIVSPPPPSSTTASTQFACNAAGCNETFSSSTKLAVHKQKHQMTLKLGVGASKSGTLNDILPVDETPTPTKFLQFGKELGIFDELNNNPFDSEFKQVTQKEKSYRANLPGLIINNVGNKPRTPTHYQNQFEQQQQHSVGQPVHVITLTPTLTSPVASLPGGPFFVPHIASPQTLLPGGLHIPSLGGNSPLAGSLISPSIMPFSPVHVAAVEAQRAVLAQAFMNAAAAASSQASTQQNNNSGDLNMHMQNTFPTHTVSIPVTNAPTPPQVAHSNMEKASSMSNINESVIQQHPQEQQQIMQDEMHHADIKPSFPAVTSVITQAPHNHLPPHQQPQQQQQHNLPSINDAMRYQFISPQQQQQQHQQIQRNVMGQPHPVHSQPFVTPPLPSSTPHNMPMPNNGQNLGSRANSHPNLTHTVSDPIPSVSHSKSFEILQNPSQVDAKKKLKAALTSNRPSLQLQTSNSTEHSQNQSSVSRTSSNDKPSSKKTLTSSVSTSSESSTSTKPSGRRPRGRASSNLDPDEKRQRFLERNRAAASRCRAKKKIWVVDLEYKAKELNNSNVCLQSEVVSLREEVASLKQLLLAHRDCPITRLQQQKLQATGMENSGNVMLTNPVSAAASLLGLSNATSSTSNNTTTSEVMDVKPILTSSDGSSYHTPLSQTNSTNSVSSVTSQGGVQTSVLVNTPKIEPMSFMNNNDAAMLNTTSAPMVRNSSS